MKSPGLRVGFRKARELFRKKKWEKRWDCGLISLKLESFFAKWPRLVRSRPYTRPIRRTGIAGDVAREGGPSDGADFDIERLAFQTGHTKVTRVWTMEYVCMRSTLMAMLVDCLCFRSMCPKGKSETVTAWSISRKPHAATTPWHVCSIPFHGGCPPPDHIRKPAN
jgi:hypothetical protein